MFNSKRIIFLIGLLSIVALTGALMAGPAFAGGNGGNGNGNGKTDSDHRVVMCHFNDEIEYNIAGDDTSGTLEAVGWYLKEFDLGSKAKHMANHGDVRTNDFEILFETEPVINDGAYNSADDCLVTLGGTDQR